MKKTILLKSVLLLCALIVGSGSVWATEAAYYTLKAAAKTGTGSNNSYTGNTDVTINNYVWNVAGNSSLAPWRIGGKKCTSATSRTVYSKTKMEEVITKVTFDFGSTFSSQLDLTSVKLTVSTAANGAGNVLDEVTKTSGFGASQTLTFTPSENKVWSKDSYYLFTFTFTTDNTNTNRFFEFDSAVFYYDDSNGSGSGSSDPSISADDVNIGENATSGSIEYTLNNASGNVSASITSGDWLTLGTITSSAVPFTCSANTGAQRTATVTLSFSGATDKVVTITQAAKTVAAPEYNVQSNGNYLAGMGIVLTSEGNTIYYNMTINGDKPSDPTNSSTPYTGPIALPEGTVKLAAIAYDSYGNISTVSNRTCIGVAPATLPFNWEGGIKSNLLNKGGVVDNGLGNDYADSKYGVYKLKFDSDGDNILIFTNEQPVKVCVGALLNGNSTSTIKIQESPDGIAYTDVQSFDVSGKQYDVTNIETTNPFTSTTRVIKILFVKSGSNIGVGPISINLAKANLNASGYATFASTYPIDFSDDSEFSAWQITGVTGNTITFSQITGTVAAGTGVLLKGTASTAANIHLVAAGTDISSTNKLVGITTATDVVADTYYGLSGNQFKKVGAGKVPAGKALLPASEVAGARELTFVFEDATGIKQVENAKMNVEGIYNLNGQRIANPTKGLYIVNGKKVIIK